MADQDRKSGELRCMVITPDRQVLDVSAQSVVLPAHDGQIGVLRNRAPLLCKLGIGVLKLQTGGKERKLFVDGGFAQVRENDVTVLTTDALEPNQIDRGSAEAALSSAKNLRITDDDSLAARTDAITRAATQLSLAGG
ncbi:MAG: ATP synthase F1 subunit epsilon [Phycisphaerae bacterium]|nr:ATP synthase F1 subunit epsilon [Phycisphaerae bacterium]